MSKKLLLLLLLLLILLLLLLLSFITKRKSTNNRMHMRSRHLCRQIKLPIELNILHTNGSKTS